MKNYSVIYAALLLCLCIAIPVSAYYDPLLGSEPYTPASVVGYLSINTVAMGGQQNCGDDIPDIYIMRVEDESLFEAGYMPDGTATGLNNNSRIMPVLLLKDGIVEPLSPFAAGKYVAILPNGNAGQEERKYFEIGGGQWTYVTFQGHATHSSHRLKPVKPSLDITRALYGKIVEFPAVYRKVCHEEVNHTVYHEATTHNITVVDVPAWDETVYHPEVNHTVHHDAITHREWVEDGHYYVHELKWFTGHGWKVKCSNHAEHGDGWHYQTSQCTEAYGHWVTITDTPAWDEIVVDTPAWSEIIHHDAITHEETIIDTKPWTEIVVDTPAYCEQVLVAPAHIEGEYVDVTTIVQGLVSDSELHILSTDYSNLFGNPAPEGYDNELHVDYTLGAASGSITVTEHENLNIP